MLKRSVRDLMASKFDFVDRKIDEGKDFKTVQNECKKIITDMEKFPEMRDYEGLLKSLREINEQEPSRERAEVVSGILKVIFRIMSTPHITEPAQGK